MRARMFVVAAMVMGTVAASGAVEVLTAKQALARAQAVVGPAVAPQLIAVAGMDSDPQLRLRVWDFTFHDPQRAQRGVVVRVKDAALIGTRGANLRLFEDARWRHFGRNFSGFEPTEVLNLNHWVFDSDRIVASVVSHPKLTGLEVTGVRLWLRKPSDGDVPPQWRVEVRARPRSDPRLERWSGFLQFSAETGQLLVDELRLGKLQP
jgi:hypothetical protein